MNNREKQGLLSDGYQVFQVCQYIAGQQAELDAAAQEVPYNGFDIAGSAREYAAGGRRLEAYIDLEDGWFVVYLPPADESWGENSQKPTPGFHPTEAGAKDEFARWLKYIKR